MRFTARTTPSEPDARYALVLDEVQRGLRQQQTSLDDLRSRATSMITAAAVVATVLGAATLTRSHFPAPLLVFTALALAAFVVVLLMAAVIVLPYDWFWGIDGHLLLASYVEADPPADLNELRRSLAYYIQDDINKNRRQLDRLHKALRVAVVALGVEVLCWCLALVLR